MIPDFDVNGNLPPIGLIRPTIQEFEERFVRADKEKIRRKIYEGYKDYCNYLILLEIASTQWVNGSYTTREPRPRDIDLVIHFDGLKLHYDEELQEKYKKLADKEVMKEKYKCHLKWFSSIQKAFLFYMIYILKNTTIG